MNEDRDFVTASACYSGVKWKADIQVLREFSREMLDELISEILYYNCSLPVIMDSKDEYQSYFHGNIILHNFVRIKEILSGVQDKNYLPVKSKGLFTEGSQRQLPAGSGGGTEPE